MLISSPSLSLASDKSIKQKIDAVIEWYRHFTRIEHPHGVLQRAEPVANVAAKGDASVYSADLLKPLERVQRYYLDSPFLQDGSLQALPWAFPFLGFDRSALPDIWQFSLDKIEEIAKLPAGWDGEEAPATTAAACNRMTRILVACTHPRMVFPTIMPDFEGGLVAEWRAGLQRVAIEVDFEGTGYAYASDERGASILSRDLAFDQGLYETLRTIRAVLDGITARANELNPGWRALFTWHRRA